MAAQQQHFCLCFCTFDTFQEKKPCANVSLASLFLISQLSFTDLCVHVCQVGDYVLFGTYIIQLYTPLNWFGTYYRWDWSGVTVLPPCITVYEEGSKQITFRKIWFKIWRSSLLLTFALQADPEFLRWHGEHVSTVYGAERGGSLICSLNQDIY